MKTETLTTKRFVIRKTLIGKGVNIKFTNAKGEKYEYSHDAVYEAHKERFEAMACFAKNKSYTQTYKMPTFCAELNIAK